MTEVTTLNPFADFDNPHDLDITKLDLPKISGHMLLVLPLKLEGKSKGGIIMASSTKERLEERTTVGKVLSMGPMAYKRAAFYDVDNNHHPWAAVGDWVIFSKMGAGTKVQFGGVHYWVLADTQVLATTDRPELAYPEFMVGNTKLTFDIGGQETN